MNDKRIINNIKEIISNHSNKTYEQICNEVYNLHDYIIMNPVLNERYYKNKIYDIVYKCLNNVILLNNNIFIPIHILKEYNKCKILNFLLWMKSIILCEDKQDENYVSPLVENYINHIYNTAMEKEYLHNQTLQNCYFLAFQETGDEDPLYIYNKMFNN
jgi:hypothetical protein